MKQTIEMECEKCGFEFEVEIEGEIGSKKAFCPDCRHLNEIKTNDADFDTGGYIEFYRNMLRSRELA